MTANVNVEIARSSNVLRVPNSALRFRPTNEMYAAIGQTPPDPAQLRADGGGRRGGQNNQQAAATPAAAPTQKPDQSGQPPAHATSDKSAAADKTAKADAQSGARAGGAPTADATGRGEGGWNGGRGGGGGRGGTSGGGGRGGNDASGGDRFASRTQNMTPEEREQRLQRMRERGFDPTATAGGNGGAPRNGRGAAPAATTPAATARQGGATTIDALFGPLPRVETTGRAWLYADKQLKQVRLRLGISDGQNTELIEGDLQQGAEVVTNIALGNETRPAATNFPFGQPGRGGFPGGGGFGGPGGGGNRGGGGGGGRGGGS
jgi:hypothetical protein